LHRNARMHLALRGIREVLDDPSLISIIQPSVIT
jgi:hypothetical protein